MNTKNAAAKKADERKRLEPFQIKEKIRVNLDPYIKAWETRGFAPDSSYAQSLKSKAERLNLTFADIKEFSSHKKGEETMREVQKLLN